MRRGRPKKFSGPSSVVALTLPTEVVRGLRKLHPDPAWAIVTLFQKRPPSDERSREDAELVSIADDEYLIVVNRAIVKSLPGVQIVPLSGDRAFLALAPGQGMSDLELAVGDRLDGGRIGGSERRALELLRNRLRIWRRDRSLTVHSRSIIVVERVARRSASLSPVVRRANGRKTQLTSRS